MAKRKTKKSTPTPRIIKMVDLYVRQLEKSTHNESKYYYDELDRILDDLFEVATDKGWSWTQLASEAGLAYQTVVNLGERFTNRPQFRTVLLLARAVDYQMLVEEREGKRPVLSIVSKAG